MVDNKPAYKPLQVQKILFSFIKVLYLREINQIIIIIIIIPTTDASLDLQNM